MDNSHCTGRQSSTQTIEVPRAYTPLRKSSTASNTPRGEEASMRASVFHGKCASIIAVYRSNPVEEIRFLEVFAKLI